MIHNTGPHCNISSAISHSDVQCIESQWTIRHYVTRSTNVYAVKSKNAACAYIKHNTFNFESIQSHGRRLYGHKPDMVDTGFSY